MCSCFFPSKLNSVVGKRRARKPWQGRWQHFSLRTKLPACPLTNIYCFLVESVLVRLCLYVLFWVCCELLGGVAHLCTVLLPS